MNRLKELRVKHGLTQTQFGTLFCAAQNTVSNWENGNREVSPDVLVRIAEYYGVSVDYILGKINDPSQVGGDEPEQELTAAVEQLAPDARATMKELLKFMQGLTDEKQTEVSTYALTSAKVMAEMNKK